MNDAFESSKAIQLPPRPDPAVAPIGDLLNAVRSIASRHLQPWVDNTFEQVDDALFDLAEKAENNAAQMHFFDGMRDVRKRRPSVERSFLSAINRELAELTQPRAPSAIAAAETPLASTELTLVADNELEESLAITSMIGKNEVRLSRDLFAVNQRLSVICGDHKIDDASNPVGPAILAQSFRHALRELNTDMRVKLIIYKLFDRYVLSALEELYHDINAELIGAGVLPQLRHEVSRGSTSTGSLTHKAASAAEATATVRIATADEPAEISGDLLQNLQALLSVRRAPAGDAHGSIDGAAAGAGVWAASLPSVNELFGALSVLQQQLVSANPSAPAMPYDSRELARDVIQLKNQLLNQIGARRGERPSQVATIDEDTIDLVSMLFEFILEDRSLPAPMQVLLARLQIPYLKAALLDRKIFAHRQHPARRLLDGLAEQAKGWSEESDRDHRLYGKVRTIVEKLLHEFDDDIGIFDRLLADLQPFHDANARRCELTEQRVAESVRGREKLELARRRAGREIIDRIAQQPLPPLAHQMLTRAWANHLVLTLLRQGEASTEYRNALNFVDDFIASTRPPKDADDRRRLAQMLPGLQQSLHEGLANVAFQEQDIERLQDQLTVYYRQQLSEHADDALFPVGEHNAALLAMPDTIQPAFEYDAEASDSPHAELAMAASDGPHWQQVKALQPGTWLEFCSVGEAVTQAKLSWISPLSWRYLFVNGRGQKVANYAPEELVALLADKQATVLSGSALFDRAMSSIVDRLSQPDPSSTPDA